MTTITVYVIESPIDSAFLHHWECVAWYPRPFVNATVDGLPAQTDDQNGVLFDTSAAHYQVDWEAPGYRGDVLMTTSPTPIPQVDFQADQQLGARILASFTPTPATPLVC